MQRPADARSGEAIEERPDPASGITRTLHARWALTESGWLAVGQRQPSATTDGSRRIGSGGPPPAPTAWTCWCPACPTRIATPSSAASPACTERAAATAGDSFWTWRERMYEAVQRLDARSLQDDRARALPVLRARGYTSVAEFHYVHRLGGSSAEETADALVDCGATPGLRLLLLPVLYRRGGLDGSPLSPRQQGFGLDLDEYGRLLQTLAATAPPPAAPVARHRAAFDARRRCRRSRRSAEAARRDHPRLPGAHPRQRADGRSGGGPASILGATPIDWLCDERARRPALGAGSCHARKPRRSWSSHGPREAVVCVCTTTEANLGDGAFDIERWWRLGGALAIGSDSNVGLDPAEELRWLEYQARLAAAAPHAAGRRGLVPSRHQPVAPGGGRRTPGLRSRACRHCRRRAGRAARRSGSATAR